MISLPSDIVRTLFTSLSARERLAMMDATPSWRDVGAEPSSWKTTIVEDAPTIAALEKTLEPHVVIETLHVHCPWETTPAASTMIAALCRLIMKHSQTLREVRIVFDHSTIKNFDPPTAFRGLCLISSHLFAICAALPRATSLHIAGLPVLAEFLPPRIEAPTYTLDGIYVMARKTWMVLYVDDKRSLSAEDPVALAAERGSIALLMTSPETHRWTPALGRHPCHAMTFLNPDDSWTGGVRFLPGEYDLFMYPRFALDMFHV